MLVEKIKRFLGLAYKDYIMVKDPDNILGEEGILDAIEEEDYRIIFYKDVEEFRYIFESQIKAGHIKRLILILKEDLYIAYDIKQWFSVCNLSYSEIFPRLNRMVLKEKRALDWDHISLVYENTYEDYSSEEMTHSFLDEVIYEKEHLMSYLKKLENDLERLLASPSDYRKWFRFLYKGIIIKHNKTEPTYTKTSLFLCEKRRFFMGRTEKGGKVF